MSELNNRLPTEEEWRDWQDHPATKAFLECFRRRKEFLKEQWAEGQYTDQQHFATAILNARAIGKCEVCDQVVALDYEEMLGELTDGE